MVRLAFKLAIAFLILHALFRYGTAYVRHHQFRDAVYETALFSREKEDAEILARVMELAWEYDIPLDRRFVQLRRQNDRTAIDASYVEEIEWLPT